MNTAQAKRWRANREARWDTNGEGSRGGHIIGRTKSGQPIYGSPATPAGTRQRKKVKDHGLVAKRLENMEVKHMSEERFKGLHINNVHEIHEAMHQAHLSGVKMPNSLGITSGGGTTSDPHGIAEAQFGGTKNPGVRGLQLSGGHFKGDKTKKPHVNPRGSRFTVSSHTRGLIHHEMAHIQQVHHLAGAGHDGKTIEGQQRRGIGIPKGSDEWKALEKDVSKYAMSDAGEFVAEVHAGVAMGETFEEATIDRFHKLTGVPAQKWKFATPREKHQDD